MASLSAPVQAKAIGAFDEIGLEPRAWDALLDSGSTQPVFMSWGWQQAWWHSFGRGRLIITVATRDGSPVAVAPWFIDDGMAFLVGSGGSDYLDVVGASEDDVVTAILGALLEAAPDLIGIRLYHVPDSSTTAASLRTAARALSLRLFDEGSLVAPAARLDAEVTAALANKKSLVRHETWFRKNGDLSVIHLRDAETVGPCLEPFFDQHVERWAVTPYPSLFLDDRQRDFYRRLTLAGSSAGWLRFTVVTWQDDPVAYHFGASRAGRYLWYKPSFAIGHARHSPGEVLLRQLLLAAHHEQATMFDFGLGDEAFKDRFANTAETVTTWGLYR